MALFLDNRGRPRKLALLALVTAALVPAAVASAAAASPSTFQRFQAEVTGVDGVPRPGPVSLGVWFFQELGLDGGPGNAGGLNSGSVMDSPAFATLFANIWLPKELKVSLKPFPGCAERTVLNSPDACPPGAELGASCSAAALRGAGAPACPAFAGGLLRPRVSPSNPDIAGKYSYFARLALRVFKLGRDNRGRRLSDTLALRVDSAITGNILVVGKVAHVSRSDERRFGITAKTFPNKLSFTIPSGLIEPVPGSVSQLTDFRALMNRGQSADRSFVRLASCPRSESIPLAYSAEYNLNLERGDRGLGRSSLANGGYSVSEIGRTVGTTAPCRR